MRIVEVLVTIELERGTQGALLHLVEDVLDINQVAVVHPEGNVAPKELFRQQRHIEPIGIESGEVTPVQPTVEPVGQGGKRRGLLHELIGDAVHRG